MNYSALLNEITTDPLGLGYAGFLPMSPGEVVHLLNVQTYTKPKSLLISERGIMSNFPSGPMAADAVLAKLEAFSITAHPYAPVVKRVLKFLSQPEGIDIGAPTSQVMLTMLGDAGVITSIEANSLKALANQPASRAEILGFGVITEADLRMAGAY